MLELPLHKQPSTSINRNNNNSSPHNNTPTNTKHIDSRNAVVLPSHRSSFTHSNYYAQLIEDIGFTKQAWLVFTLASLLQFIWGQETCFISINMDYLARTKNIPQHTISLSICILYSMMGIGSACVGVLTKHTGRIFVLELTILIHLLTTVLCSVISPLTFFPIMLLRCINNISIGVFNIVALNLMSEFFPTRNRSLVLMINSGFYNVGNLYTILINNMSLDLKHFSTTKWKLINLNTLIPGIIAICIVITCITESPLYLLNKNRQHEGFRILQRMKQCTITEDEQQRVMQAITSKKNYKLKSHYKELFTKEYYKLTMLSLCICAICYLNMIGITYLIPKTLQNVNEVVYSVSYGMQIFIYGVIQLPNGIVGGLMTESVALGRRITIWFSALMCAVFYFVSALWMKYVAIYGGIIMLFNSICFGCAFIYVTEVFPTNLRDIAQSFIQCFSFVLGSWSPLVVNAIQYKVSYVVLGVTNVVCVVLGVILPVDTLLRPLDEDII